MWQHAAAAKAAAKSKDINYVACVSVSSIYEDIIGELIKIICLCYYHHRPDSIGKI